MDHRYKLSNTLENYIEEKICMLEEEFYLKLTDDEKYHFYRIKTEEAVDTYAQKLIMEKL